MIVTFCGHARVDYPPSVREDMLAVLRRFSEGGEELEFLIGGYGNFDFLALACARTLQKEGVRVRACGAGASLFCLSVYRRELLRRARAGKGTF